MLLKSGQQYFTWSTLHPHSPQLHSQRTHALRLMLCTQKQSSLEHAEGPYTVDLLQQQGTLSLVQLHPLLGCGYTDPNENYLLQTQQVQEELYSSWLVREVQENQYQDTEISHESEPPNITTAPKYIQKIF
eukprot:TRINITY_DN3948_c0_g1_i1.p3 TRINITY_DN3948_c0_g1~~TRINITY_DN3948_c0_g1_i1.p3  ORF type:complete len:131 (-),score=0.27 TRINITY_DN3948_c0_g1_i1:93-485(-)